MKKLNKVTLVLVIVAYICIALSIISMFTTVISYTNSKGICRTFSILDFWKSSDYDTFVSSEYVGVVYLSIPVSVIRLFSIAAVCAEICAVIGLLFLSQQKERLWPLVLTIGGLLGTMAPSLLIWIAVFLLRDGYPGAIKVGIYPFVSISAKVISIMAAVMVYERNIKFRKKRDAIEAEGLMGPSHF